MAVVAIVGPTAAGKSAAALAIAEALGGEVVNADSMQLYRGMDIGTAKLAPAEWRGVPHHLLDVWDVTRTASVVEYQRLARAVIEAVGVPVVVGGSGLYVRGALDDFEFPPTDPGVRARLETELAEIGSEPLYERLVRLDPVAAQRIQPANGRRVVRALEVVAVTGRRFSDQPGMTAYQSHYPTTYVGLAPDLATLDARIEARVDAMWRSGFVDEVRSLERAGLRDGLTARRALGYEQVLGFLAGATTEADAMQRTKQATRRYARRQLSWFRRDPRVTWYATTTAAVVAITG